MNQDSKRYATIAYMSAVLILAINAYIPLGYASWVFYLLPLLIFSQRPDGRSLYVLAAVCSGFVVAGSFLSSDLRLDPACSLFNRVSGIVMLWAVALLLQSRNKALRTLQQAQIAEARREGEVRLRDAKLRVAAVLTALDVGTWVWDVARDRLQMDQNFAGIFGLGDVDTREVPIEAVVARIHPDDRKTARDMIDRGLSTGEPYEADYRVAGPDGAVRWVTCRGKSERKDGRRPDTLFGVVIDSTKRKFWEEALRASEARFSRAIFDSPLPIMIHSEDGRVVTVNNTWTEITGYTRDQIPTIAQWTEKAYGDKKELVKAGIDKLYSIDRKVGQGESAIRTSGGESRIWEFSSTPLGRDERGMRLIMSVAMDVTERKKAELALRESQKRLELLTQSLEEKVIERTAQVRDLTRELTVSEQKERKRLSRILHDELQQVLFSAIMRFDLVEMEFERIPAEMAEEIRTVRESVRRAVEMSRTLALELNPPVLASEGLDAALGWLAHFMTDRYGLRIEADVHGECKEIPEEQRILLVQLVRELFQNILKHARIREATLHSGVENGELVISVEDKGAGFDPAKIREMRDGEGLLGFHRIEERLRLFGGRLSIQSAPQSGTRVKITVPIPKRESNA